MSITAKYIPVRPELLNPELDQPRLDELPDMFARYERLMFEQQRVIYARIAQRVSGLHVLEAGCGLGLGAAIMHLKAASVFGTDKLKENVRAAQELYPFIGFDVWDFTGPTDLHAEVVVCVEAIEHVADPVAGLVHLVRAAGREVWLSTPNGACKDRPCANPYHVCEYTPSEMMQMINRVAQGMPEIPPQRLRSVRIHDWESGKEVGDNTSASPLIYHLVKE